MATAFLSSMRSITPTRQGGACIVNKDNRIVGMGYCGYPRGLDHIPETGDDSDKPSYYICHSIMNAILNKNQWDIRGCRIYCTHFPCNECAKLIIQSGMSRVTYSVEPSDQLNCDASRILFTLAGVSICRFTPSRGTVVTIDDDVVNRTLPPQVVTSGE